jgi:hypothetical protein
MKYTELISIVESLVNNNPNMAGTEYLEAYRDVEDDHRDGASALILCRNRDDKSKLNFVVSMTYSGNGELDTAKFYVYTVNCSYFDTFQFNLRMSLPSLNFKLKVVKI